MAILVLFPLTYKGAAYMTSVFTYEPSTLFNKFTNLASGSEKRYWQAAIVDLV